jgi:hypothetical protein
MNEQIKIAYTVPQAVALAAGSSRYGAGEFAVSDEQIAELSQGEALHIAERRTFTLAGLPSWETVRAAVRESYAALVAKREESARAEAKAVAVAEREIARVLALPDEAFAIGPWDACLPHCEERSLVSAHPEVRARVAALRERGEERARERTRLAREADAAREAAKEAKEAAFVEACKRFALGVPDLARAASENYNVTGAVLAHVAGQVARAKEALDPRPAGVVLRDGTKAWEEYTWEEQATPNARAFEVYDAVKAHLETLAKPDGLVVRLDRIMRITKTYEYNDSLVHKYTGVVVWLAGPGQKDRVVVLDTEA